MRHRCHRVRDAGRNPDAVLRLAIAGAYRTIPESDGLCRPDDASILSGLRLDAAATSRLIGVAVKVSIEPEPARLLPRPAPPPVPRSAYRATPVPPPRRRHRTFAEYAAGSWCPTRQP